MSRGFGADAVLEMQDEQIAVYCYGSYNLNIEEYRNPEHIMDGLILIEKSTLPEPELHDKTKRLSNGKKHTIKKSPRRWEIDELLRTGQIRIQNSCFRWEFLHQPYDLMAIRLLRKISVEYQLSGSLPEHTGLMY